MPAPNNPNTAAATAAVRRRGQETMAAKLREAGWTVTPPRESPAGQDNPMNTLNAEGRRQAATDLHNHRVRIEYRHAHLAGTFVTEGILMTRTVALDSARTPELVLISPDGTLGAATFSLSVKSIVAIDDLGAAG